MSTPHPTVDVPGVIQSDRQALSAAGVVPTVALSDRTADKKLKNRLAQRRHRAKNKAELAAVEQRVADVTRSLVAARASIAVKREQLCAVQQRLQVLKSDAGRLPGRRHLLGKDLGDHATSAFADQPRVSHIFRPPRAEGSPLPHAVAISLSRLPVEGSMVHRISAFQAQAAARLGCGAEEVAWAYQCEFRPDITRDAPIPSNLPSPGCQAHMLVAWMAARLECAMLLAIWTRIERASAGLPFERPAAPRRSLSTNRSGDAALSADFQGVPAPQRPRHSPDVLRASASHEEAIVFEPAATASTLPPLRGAPAQRAAWRDASVAPAAPGLGGGRAAPAHADAVAPSMDAIAELSERVFAFFLDGPAPGSAPSSPPPSRPSYPRGAALTQSFGRWSQPGALASFTALVQKVADAIFAEYVPLMHPADVVQLTKRLAAAFGAQTKPQGHEPLTPRSGVATLFFEVMALARQATRDACSNPKLPALPTTQEAASRRKLELETRMGCVYRDWTLLYVLFGVGCPVWAQKACVGYNPATTAELAKAEQQNLKAYVALALSTEQKRALKAGMTWFRTVRRELLTDRADLAAKLDALLSAEHLELRNLLAVPARAAPRSGQLSGGGDAASRRRSPDPAPGVRLCGSTALPVGPASATAAAQSATGLALPMSPDRRPLRLSGLPEPGSTSRALALHRATPLGAHEAFAWAGRLLGACPEATEAASDALFAIRRLHMEQHVLYIDTLCAFKEALTPRQQAGWLTAQLPFIADSHRIADMAATDLGRDRVYGVPRIR